MLDGVVELVKAGFEERQVLFHWPYDKFIMFSRAARRQRLQERVEFVSDVAQSIGGLFAEKGKTPLKDHIDELTDTIERLNGFY